MSGPKCGQAHLSQERLEALRRQRVREERIRAARDAHRRDEQRERLELQYEQRAGQVLKHAESLLKSFRAEAQTQAGSELEVLEAKLAETRAKLMNDRQTLEHTRRQFAMATEEWLANPEQYHHDYFGSLNLSIANRRSEATLQEVRNLSRLVAARRSEQEQNSTTTIQTSTVIEQARANRNFVQETGGTVAEIDAVIAQAEQLVQANDNATENAVHALAGQVEEALNQAQDWQKALETAEVGFAPLRDAVAAITGDTANPQHWASELLDPVLQQSEQIEAQFKTIVERRDIAAFTDLLNQVPTLIEQLKQGHAAAIERRYQEKSRRQVVAAFDQALQGLGFQVGINLVDSSNPSSPVLLEASHGDMTQHFEIDQNGKVNMNLKDGIKGADCIADLQAIIERLQTQGVNLQMTDMGSADLVRARSAGIGIEGADESSAGVNI